jgi:hypothetical protein
MRTKQSVIKMIIHCSHCLLETFMQLVLLEGVPHLSLYAESINSVEHEHQRLRRVSY